QRRTRHWPSQTSRASMADRQRNPPRSEVDQKRLRPEEHPDPRSRHLNRQLRNKLAASPLDSAHGDFVRSYCSESKRFPAIDADVKQPGKRWLNKFYFGARAHEIGRAHV